ARRKPNQQTENRYVDDRKNRCADLSSIKTKFLSFEPNKAGGKRDENSERQQSLRETPSHERGGDLRDASSARFLIAGRATSRKKNALPRRMNPNAVAPAMRPAEAPWPSASSAVRNNTESNLRSTSKKYSTRLANPPKITKPERTRDRNLRVFVNADGSPSPASSPNATPEQMKQMAVLGRMPIFPGRTLFKMAMSKAQPTSTRKPTAIATKALNLARRTKCV